MKHDRLNRECRQTRLWLDEYSGGELSVAQARAVGAHLKICNACRQEYSALTITQQALARYPRIQASPDFNIRVLGHILQQDTRADSLFDRLDAIFARPLYKLMGSAILSFVLGILTLSLVVGPRALVSSLSTANRTNMVMMPMTTANSGGMLSPFYASSPSVPSVVGVPVPAVPPQVAPSAPRQVVPSQVVTPSSTGG